MMYQCEQPEPNHNNSNIPPFNHRAIHPPVKPDSNGNEMEALFAQNRASTLANENIRQISDLCDERDLLANHPLVENLNELNSNTMEVSFLPHRQDESHDVVSLQPDPSVPIAGNLPQSPEEIDLRDPFASATDGMELSLELSSGSLEPLSLNIDLGSSPRQFDCSENINSEPTDSFDEQHTIAGPSSLISRDHHLPPYGSPFTNSFPHGHQNHSLGNRDQIPTACVLPQQYPGVTRTNSLTQSFTLGSFQQSEPRQISTAASSSSVSLPFDSTPSTSSFSGLFRPIPTTRPSAHTATIPVAVVNPTFVNPVQHADPGPANHPLYQPIGFAPIPFGRPASGIVGDIMSVAKMVLTIEGNLCRSHAIQLSC